MMIRRKSYTGTGKEYGRKGAKDTKGTRNRETSLMKLNERRQQRRKRNRN
jgi:hypothetical protein